jgi:hypothetical protein
VAIQTPAKAVEQAAEAIQDAAHRRRDTEPHHNDFYAIATATEHVLAALFAMNANIGGQLTYYGNGRQLRTDTDRDPAEVLAAAMTHGQALHTALTQARQAAHNLANECARLAIMPNPRTRR